MSKQHHKTRVLVVDDAAGVRRDLRLLLELSADLEVVGEAGNGHQALEMAAGLRPHVVILDLAMPGLDGYQTAVLIRSQLDTCRLVALTVNATEAARQRAQAAGFNAYVVKGAAFSELLQAIDPRLDHTPSAEGGLS